MKLDRNINNHEGKYALIKLRELQTLRGNIRAHGLTSVMVPTKDIDFGDTRDSDFFVIRLKDKYAGPALEAYAVAASDDDPEWAQEVAELAKRAYNHASKKKPD